MADDFIDARWQIEAAPDEHTEMRSQPAHQSLLNRRLEGSASSTAQPLNSALACPCNRISQLCLASLTTNIRVTEGSGGAIQQHFNVGTALDLLVTWPPKAEQEKIVAFVDHVTSSIDALCGEAETAVALLQERRLALISAAVTGKIDVRGLVPDQAEAA